MVGEVNSVATTTPPPTNQAVFNQSLVDFAHGPSLFAATTAAVIDPNGLLAAEFPASLEASGQAPPQTGIVEGLFAINTDTLKLLNEVSTNPTSATIGGNLTSQQLQEIGVLQQDALRLEDAAFVSNHIPLTNTATTVDLSLAAQGIAQVGTITPAQPLTAAQLAQIAQIIAPFLNEPLTPALLLQMQTQLNANQPNPIQLNMNILLLVQNFIGSFQAAQYKPAETKVAANENTETVAPVESVDRVAIEDNAILA